MISFVSFSDLNKTHFRVFVQSSSQNPWWYQRWKYKNYQKYHKVKYSNMCECTQVTFSRPSPLVSLPFTRSNLTVLRVWPMWVKFGDVNKLRKHCFQIHSFMCNDLDSLTFSRPCSVVSLPFTQYNLPGSHISLSQIFIWLAVKLFAKLTFPIIFEWDWILKLYSLLSFWV